MKKSIVLTLWRSARKAFAANIGQRRQFQLQEQLASIAAAVPGFLFTIRLDTGGRSSWSFASSGVADLFGLRPEEIYADVALMSARYHSDDMARIEQLMRETARTLAPLRVEVRVTHPEQGQRWIEIRATPQRQPDGSTEWHGVMLDITERKQNSQALEEARRCLASVMTTIPDYVFLKNTDGVYLTCNPIFERFFGAREADIVGKTDYDFLSTELSDFFRQKDREAMNADHILTNEEWVTLAEDGRRLLLETRKVAVRSADGNVTGVLGIGRDITERHQREEELSLLNYAIDHVEKSVFLIDNEARISYVNKHACRSLGYSREQLLGLSIPDIDMNYQHALWQQHWRDIQANGSRTFETAHKTNDGAIFPVEIIDSYFESGGRGYNLAIARDISAFKEAQKALCKSEREFRTLAENSPDTIARYDGDGRRRYANRKLITDLGGDLTQILGSTPVEFPGGADAQGYLEKIREVFEHGQPRDFEMHWQPKDIEFCTLTRLTPEFDEAGQVVQVLAVGRDITEIDQYRKQVQRQAFYDELTDLPNRALLFNRIRQAIAHNERRGGWFGVMILDLDHFKEVNDTLGHAVGDRLLCEVAQRLKNTVRATDTVARLGGDEFGILLPEVSERCDLSTVADKILQALEQPFAIDRSELFVSCSIGIALYPDNSAEMDALLKYADTAMYYAKKQGRNNCQFYARELSIRTLERRELELALRKARRNGELALHFQPQIDLPSGRVVGAEALLRWHHPEHGMVRPDRFISIAEESGLIVDIGEWVLASACAVVTDWNRDQGMGLTAPIKMAINVSTRQFLRNDLVGSVRRVLADTGCRAEWLELEITESLLLEDTPEVARMLADLAQMGISISIDDFGTGYSALSYLHRFPVTQIKVDQSFVRDIPHERGKCELVKAMLAIGTALQFDVVAEGVETEAQAHYLMEHGCRLAQGYLFGKPVPRDAFEAMLIGANAQPTKVSH
jgi:diguanylate cyclase (GGDEF)-like protein/PAS domain S-box-containing protein